MNVLYKLLVLLLCSLNIQNWPRCTLNSRRDFTDSFPVVVKNQRYLEPTDSSGNIELAYGESLTLSCGSEGPIQHPLARSQWLVADIFCEGGDNFQNSNWLEGSAIFSLFSCPLPPEHMSQRTNRTCYNNHSIIEVGYKVQDTFYPLYESCFDDGIFNVLYSKYTQKPFNANFQTRVNRPYFKADDLFGNIPVNALFSPHNLKESVKQLVGTTLIDRYVTQKEFLSRGHLAAKTDFVFAFGQRATFHYANCAPQWYGLNGGNWNTLEVDLRNHINAMGYDTIIYTGTYGVSQLYDENERRVDLYLTRDYNNNPVIPIPLYYYKAVYETNSQKGIVFLGINNPYYSRAEAEDLFFCRDLCRNNRDFSWLTWHPDNPKEGYTFCCSVSDFRNTVHHLPDFDVQGLLV